MWYEPYLHCVIKCHNELQSLRSTAGPTGVGTFVSEWNPRRESSTQCGYTSAHDTQSAFRQTGRGDDEITVDFVTVAYYSSSAKNKVLYCWQAALLCHFCMASEPLIVTTFSLEWQNRDLTIWPVHALYHLVLCPQVWWYPSQLSVIGLSVCLSHSLPFYLSVISSQIEAAN